MNIAGGESHERVRQFDAIVGATRDVLGAVDEHTFPDPVLLHEIRAAVDTLFLPNVDDGHVYMPRGHESADAIPFIPLLDGEDKNSLFLMPDTFRLARASLARYRQISGREQYDTYEGPRLLPQPSRRMTLRTHTRVVNPYVETDGRWVSVSLLERPTVYGVASHVRAKSLGMLGRMMGRGMDAPAVGITMAHELVHVGQFESCELEDAEQMFAASNVAKIEIEAYRFQSALQEAVYGRKRVPPLLRLAGTVTRLAASYDPENGPPNRDILDKLALAGVIPPEAYSGPEFMKRLLGNKKDTGHTDL